MENLSLNEQESKLLSFLSSSDINNFLLYFNLYLSANPNNQDTLFLKAAALLSHLSLNNLTEFYKLIQIIKIDEISDKNIETVLKVFDAVSCSDLHSLKEICKSCPANLKKLVENMIEGQLEISEMAIKETIKNENKSNIDDDSIQVIKNCIYVTKNFMGN